MMKDTFISKVFLSNRIVGNRERGGVKGGEPPMMKDTFISKVFLSNRIVGNNFNCRFVIISVFKCFQMTYVFIPCLTSQSTDTVKSECHFNFMGLRFKMGCHNIVSVRFVIGRHKCMYMSIYSSSLLFYDTSNYPMLNVPVNRYDHVRT